MILKMVTVEPFFIFSSVVLNERTGGVGIFQLSFDKEKVGAASVQYHWVAIDLLLIINL